VIVFDGVDELAAAVGTDLGQSEWLTIDADRIASFVDAAGDTTYFAVSLTNFFLPQLLEVRNISMGVNYGTGQVVLGPPLAAGTRVRAAAVVAACEPVKGGVQATVRVTVSVDGHDEPACVVEALSRYLA
jgi:acyl dehydratase